MTRFRSRFAIYQKPHNVSANSGFVYLPLIIATTVLIPLAYLFWPAMTTTVNTVSTIANVLAVIVAIGLVLILLGVLVYLFYWIRRRGLVAMIRRMFRACFDDDDHLRT